MARVATKIVVFRYGQLGDALVALPAMRVVRQNFPAAEVVLLEPQRLDDSWVPCSEVFRHQGVIDRVRSYRPGARGKDGWLGAVRVLREERCDVLIYLAPRLRGVLRRIRDLLAFRLAGVSKVAGHRGFRLMEMRKRRGERAPLVEHEIDHLLRRLRRSGLRVPEAGNADATFVVRDEDRESLERKVPGVLGALRRGHGMAVVPGSKWPSKQWPLGRYERVVTELAERDGVIPVVFGGGAERELGNQVLERCRSGVNLAGLTSVPESAAALSECKLYLGNDTGAMHLAAAVGTPCVVPFSAQDWPGRWYPYGAFHRVLRTDVECETCQLIDCQSEGLRCLTGIDVDVVLSKCREALSEAASREKGPRA